MFRTDSRALVLSVGDLVRASRCEYALLCDVDRVLGRAEKQGATTIDSAWVKLLHRGQLHEKQVLAEYRSRYGVEYVAEIARPRELSESSLTAASDRTIEAMRKGARVVYQATIFDGRLLGYADFLIRESDGRWRIEDSKLTTAAGFEARLQVAAYSAVLGAAGIALTTSATLRLGDGTEAEVVLDDVVPAFMRLRDRLHSVVDDHVAAGGLAAWDGDRACGRCAHCADALAVGRDVLLVGGVGPEERRALHAAGIRTIDELAVAAQIETDLPASVLDRLRRQAALQLEPGALPNVPSVEVVRAELLGRLPKADPGDLFLSFAAQDRSDDEDVERDHLFTVLGVTGAVQTYWGDDRLAEAAEFGRFLRALREHRRLHPGMRIIHYSPVERPHLIDLADRAGAGRAEVEALIAEGVLVDLYSVLDQAVLVGTPDRGLRQVGRLADPDLAHGLAGGDVATDRAEYRRLLATGEIDDAASLRSRLERENLERSILTKRLRDHILDLMETEGIEPGSMQVPKRSMRRRSEVAQAIDTIVRAGGDDIHLLASAALDYHSLELSVFLRSHQRRRHRHTSEWSTRTRGALRIDSGSVEQDWTEGPRGGSTRTLRLQVTASPGTVLRVDGRPYLVYDGEPAFDDPRSAPGARTATGCVVIGLNDDGVLVQERLPMGAAPWQTLPSALAPARPPTTSTIETAVERWAASLLRDDPRPSAATDLVRRSSRRIDGGDPTRALALDGRLDVTASLLESIEALDGSFLAVQGPPGSGKTTVGAEVIAELVARGWRIGVVAQSHAVVEHFLDRVVAAGAPADRVAKHVRQDNRLVRFTPIGRDSVRSFMRDHQTGFVVGGTA